MPKESIFKKVFNFLFAKLFIINDSAQKIALGVGLGVFSGILPGTGPLIALFLAFIFRANRAAALIGSLLTNTWLSLITFVFAIKVGSAILKLNWHNVFHKAQFLFKDFSFTKFFKLSFSDVFLPVLVGYLAISLILGVFSYLVTLLIIRRRFHGNKTIHP
ncbi:MAG: DUF2062 domain-containing protein [Candidatus Omnitrophota bacterium]